MFSVPEKIKKQPPNHVVIVQWVEHTLTVLAQAPVPHADRTEKRVLFVDHRPGLIPQLEAIGIAKGIAKKNKHPTTILVQQRDLVVLTGPAVDRGMQKVSPLAATSSQRPLEAL